MVKTLISIISVAIILTAGIIYENYYVNKEFKELNFAIERLYEKTISKTAVADDVYAVQSNWLEKKRHLHVFVSHNEIRELELWIAESVVLIKDKEWTDALSKIEVLKELTEQLPKNFSFSLENVF